MVPNRHTLISIEIWGWLQENKQKCLFGPNHAARATKQQANYGPWLGMRKCARSTVRQPEM
jgi:hypothetical protein